MILYILLARIIRSMSTLHRSHNIINGEVSYINIINKKVSYIETTTSHYKGHDLMITKDETIYSSSILDLAINYNV